ncbi:PAS domain S-box protein [Sphingomonas sp. ST-64]|uniref:histidine kinase n=1 Tax=Sphingomonas plantiphila TaxID=3163295 RepID=A0ABW8YNT3_9SPHN
MGWLFAISWLRSPIAGFADPWPPSLVAIAILATTLVLFARPVVDARIRRIGAAIVAVVIVIAAILLNLTFVVPNAGSPVSCLLIFLLSTSALIQMRAGREGAPIAAMIAALVISFALLLLAGQLLAADVRGATIQPWHIPIITNVAALTLGIGLLLLATQHALRAYRTEGDERWPIALRAVPTLMVAPAIVLAIELLVFDSRDFPVTAEIWGMLANTLIVGSVLLWSVASLSRHRSKISLYAQSLDSEPIAFVDRDGRIVQWSRGCASLYGFGADEAIGRLKHKLLASRAAPGESADWSPTASQGSFQIIETGKDGRELRLLERRQKIGDDDDAPITVLAMTDLGPLMRAQVARKDSEERLLLAAQAHRIGIFEWDVATGKLAWFADTEPLLGLPAGTLTDYESWAERIVPEDLAVIRTRMEAVRERQLDRFSFFYRLTLADGKMRAIEGSARCFYDSDGTLVRTLGVNIDVTDRVEQTAQLVAREAQLRSILETVPSAMVVIDERGTILSFSPAAERLFGYAVADVVGRNVSMLMGDEHRVRHDDYLDHYLRTGERRIIGIPQILTARHADGSEIPIELHVGEAVYDDTRVFTGFITDLTERLQTEERFQQLSNELTQIGRVNAMGELGATLAHELNQPLAAIANHIATAEVILQTSGDLERIAGQLQSTREQALRAGEIIRRLRGFVSRREIELRAEPVEETIREASALVLVGHQRVDLALHYDFAPDAQLMLADKIQIQQVLVNLMRNALEALAVVAAEHRRIDLVTRRVEGDWIEISVCDNGPGVDEPVLEQMFQPFNSSKGEGSMGFGLLICRRIVEAHGGTMSAHNNKGGGSTFRFTVPGIEPGVGEE